MSAVSASAAKTNKAKSAAASTLTADELRRMDAYWRACNYLSVGMLYLKKNPLLREPLKAEHIKDTVAGALGFGCWAELYVGASESADQEVRSGFDLSVGAGAWGSCYALELLSRRRVLGGLSG